MTTNTMSKADWVGLFQELGLSEAQMMRWHELFERRHPEGHQSFLEWLGLPKQEIHSLRRSLSEA